MPIDYSNSKHEITWTDLGTQDGDLIFNGTSSRGELVDNDDWHLSGDFTFELFGVVFDDASGTQNFLSQWRTPSDRSFAFQFHGDTSPKTLRLTFSPNGTSTMFHNSDEWVPTVSTRYDVCIERSGNDLRFYIDGSLLSKTTMTEEIFNASAVAAIGEFATSGNVFSGELRALRLTNGTAIYADDGGYTVPDLPLPTA